MTDQPTFQRLSMSLCGPIAREVVAEDGDVQVVDAIEGALYLACGSGVICLGSPDLVAGPINVATGDSAAWSAVKVSIEDEGRVADGVMTVADAFALDVTGGATWQPPAWPPFDADRLARGVMRLRAMATGLPVDGLANLIFQPDRAPPARSVAEAASASVAHLRDALPQAIRRQGWTADGLRAALLLVGLGPGATPQGDNLLGGVMLALSATGLKALRDQLWSALESDLDALTTLASAMHMSAAADGLAALPVLEVLAATMSDDDATMRSAYETSLELPHTPGAEIVAGAVLAFEALLAIVGTSE